MSDAATPRTYPEGTACWIDLETPDALAAAPFYEAVFGWTLTDAMPPDAPGHYLIATLDGQDVGAIASGAASIAGDAAWSTYFAVDDADAAARAVEAAGGTVFAPPADTPGGRPVACLDPQGAAFRLWQAGRRLGAQTVNRPGGWVFSALLTADEPASLAFYRSFLPWYGEAPGGFIRVPGYGDHLAAGADPDIRERQVGAPEGFADVTAAIAPLPDGEPPRWQVLFSVADRDAAVKAVLRAGGAVDAARQNEWTRDADVRDPAGARFGLSQFAPADR